ncbi:thrombospondin type 3 repeat-containing protein, partial [bacterium]|nr:thrombospondin type 3 repeat-containing protein [bacterium]
RLEGDDPLICSAWKYSEVIDSDLDGILNTADNCPDIYNPDQADEDVDQVGDLCDIEEEVEEIVEEPVVTKAVVEVNAQAMEYSAPEDTSASLNEAVETEDATSGDCTLVPTRENKNIIPFLLILFGLALIALRRRQYS